MLENFSMKKHVATYQFSYYKICISHPCCNLILVSAALQSRYDAGVGERAKCLGWILKRGGRTSGRAGKGVGWSSGWLTQQREGALINQVRTIEEGRVVINMAHRRCATRREEGTLKTLWM